MSPLAQTKVVFSYIDILNIPKNYDHIKEHPYLFKKLAEATNQNFYNWEKRAEDAFNTLIFNYGKKLIRNK